MSLPTTTRPPPTPTPEPATDDLPPAVVERLDHIWSLAYGARSKEDLLQLYAEWAKTYDEDHDVIGFFGHRLTAEVLARHVTRHDVARVLDAGAGTGAAGEALHALGFRDLHALDLSPEMLEVAREKDLYRELGVADLGFPVDKYRTGAFDAVVLVGVFSYGQAPPSALDEAVRLTRAGGLVTFTTRTDFHEEDAMGVRSRMEELEASGVWSLVERTEPHPYLPAKDPDALFRVWCYRVTGNGRAEVENGFGAAAKEAFKVDEDGVVRFDHAWIWDSAASRLYDRYTETDGYYLTDCEEQILADHAKRIWNDEELLVELGCGSARKISHVLEVCAAGSDAPVRYVPIDVSRGALEATEREVLERFSDDVEVEPRQGMFEKVLSDIPSEEGKLIFFFGSSLGNLESIEATVEFLARLRRRMGPRDRLVAGVDLEKDPEVFDAAYNEGEACRRFFAHMIRRVNRHLGADFDPRAFELASTYEEEPEVDGITTHVVNLRVAPKETQRTWVKSLDQEVQLDAGQPVQVGVSRKFSAEALRDLASLAGLRLRKQWLDRKGWYSLNEMVPAGAPA